MNHMIIRIVSICLVLVAGCATAPKVEEHILWSFKNGKWEHGSTQYVEGRYMIIEYVPKGESVQDWSELVTIQNFSKKLGSPESFLDQLKTLREKQCPGSTVWNVIAQDKDSILYEWMAKPCEGWPDQHEISRILDGKWNRFRIAYTVKVKELQEEERNIWIKSMLKATIEER